MTTPTLPESMQNDIQPEKEERKRRTLLLILLLLLLLLCCVGYFAVRYLIQPQPVTQMLPAPIAGVAHYPPTYKASATGLDEPIAVAASPDGKFFYAAEGAGDRLLKKFGSDGTLLKTFSPPGTTKSSRNFAYMAVDPSGRLFVVDRHNYVIDIFDADGNFVDAILAPDMTISKYLASTFPQGVPAKTELAYDGLNRMLTYTELGKKSQSLKVNLTVGVAWYPLGIRFDRQGNLIYTDTTQTKHSVHIIPAAALTSLPTFNPTIPSFGSEGSDAGQLNFPNVAVMDNKGNFYVSDGNNYRLSVFTSDLKYKTFFGSGNIASGVNLPRGLWVDQNNLLHVADAVGNTIRVYDLSSAEPAYLYSFGSEGVDGGQFGYPIDICMDATGRVYVADRGNGRIQIWSY